MPVLPCSHEYSGYLTHLVVLQWRVGVLYELTRPMPGKKQPLNKHHICGKSTLCRRGDGVQNLAMYCTPALNRAVCPSASSALGVQKCTIYLSMTLPLHQPETITAPEAVSGALTSLLSHIFKTFTMLFLTCLNISWRKRLHWSSRKAKDSSWAKIQDAESLKFSLSPTSGGLKWFVLSGSTSENWGSKFNISQALPAQTFYPMRQPLTPLSWSITVMVFHKRNVQLVYWLKYVMLFLLLFKSFKEIYFILCVCMWCVYAWCPQKPEEGHQIPLTCSCIWLELSCGYHEPNLGPRQE